ncbi:four helix bundle protein [bacterium B17]|nr:four helix bundle protein [bacterium B17]
MQYDLEDRLIDFSVRVIKGIEELPKTKAGDHIAKQLVRSGTSAAPNYGEAQGAESRADFIHKMKVCLKELRETKIWFRIIKKAALVADPGSLDSILEECDQLIAIFVSSLKTASQNQVNNK